MRDGFVWVLAALLAVIGCAKPESLVMRPTVSPEGWNGNAFYRNNIIASEEFSTGEHGPAVDVWRFYDGYGRLYTEERDTTGNGVRNLYRGYDKDGQLVAQKEDTDGDGVYDRTIDYTKKRQGNSPAIKDIQAPAQPRETTAQGPRQRKRPAEWEWSKTSAKQAEKRRSTKVQPVPQPAKTPAARPSQRTLETPPAVALEPAPIAPAASATDGGYRDAYRETAPAPAPAANRENYIRPVPMPPSGYVDSANANSRVVPGPVFHHPSDDLED